MLMPTVFHENLFDDFFDPFWNDAALERMMNREARDTFGTVSYTHLLHVFSRPDAGPERSRDLQNEKRLFLPAPERPHRTCLLYTSSAAGHSVNS